MNEHLIKIYEPSEEEMTFLVGETKILDYKVRSVSDFKVKDLIFSVETLIKDGKNIRKTDEEYVKIISTPKILYPGREGIVKIEVKLPTVYKEYITKEDGNKSKQPFRIKLHVKGIEHIEEI